MNQVELFFHDLKPEAQAKVLKAAGLKSADEGNLDLAPLAVLDYEVEPVERIQGDSVCEACGREPGPEGLHIGKDGLNVCEFC